LRDRLKTTPLYRLHHTFRLGLYGGEHTGWAIIEAKTSNEALLVVPPTQRSTTEVVRLNKFSPSDVEKMHLSQS